MLAIRSTSVQGPSKSGHTVVLKINLTDWLIVYRRAGIAVHPAVNMEDATSTVRDPALKRNVQKGQLIRDSYDSLLRQTRNS